MGVGDGEARGTFYPFTFPCSPEQGLQDDKHRSASLICGNRNTGPSYQTPKQTCAKI